MIEPISSFAVFIVRDLAKAKEFYSNHLGFSVAFENEWYLHLAAESGVQIGFMLPDQPTQPDIFRQAHNGQGAIFSLEVPDADKAYAEARESSLDIVLDLVSEDWGQRHFSLQDPNGLYVDVVQAIEPSGEYKEGYAQQ